jgi:hypothetical protein
MAKTLNPRGLTARLLRLALRFFAGEFALELHLVYGCDSLSATGGR